MDIQLCCDQFINNKNIIKKHKDLFNEFQSEGKRDSIYYVNVYNSFYGYHMRFLEIPKTFWGHNYYGKRRIQDYKINKKYANSVLDGVSFWEDASSDF